MATERTRYVNTASSGGDGTTSATAGANAAYASLDAALDAEAADLVTADVFLVINCAGSTADGIVTLDQAGWTTDATRYIRIVGDLDGAVFDATKYRIQYTGASGVVGFTYAAGNNAPHLYMDNVQIRMAATHNNAGRAFQVNTGITDGTSFFELSNCIFELDHNDATDSIAAALVVGLDGDPDYRFRNCIFYVASTSSHTATDNGIEIFSGATSYVHNCTISGFADGVGIASSSALVAKNTLIDGCGTDFGTLNGSSNYNASSDGTAPGANSRTTQTFTFVGTDDFRLASGDGGAKDFGTSLAADGNLAVTDDIVGTSRPQGSAYDIGAFEVVSAGGGSSIVALVRRRRM